MKIPEFKGDCIIWDGYINPQGYGQCNIGNRKHRNAHLIAWENVNGPKPDGMVIDHLCRNRACVNIDHLELVTPKENTLRGEGLTAVNARKTHCVHGHPFSGSNLGTDHRGHRQCKTCQARFLAEYGERRRVKNETAKLKRQQEKNHE